jgi:ubiquinone biosynthesis protein UbiJ
MAEIDLQFIGEQLARVLDAQREMRELQRDTRERLERVEGLVARVATRQLVVDAFNALDGKMSLLKAEIAEELSREIRMEIGGRLAPLASRVDALEARIAELTHPS